ncbi:MAG TPA: nucleotidyltransferase [Firmicutes bacterium]|jgi:hypothetical protein|nr:nucleotidyltransferase [Bacillota bacterium]
MKGEDIIEFFKNNKCELKKYGIRKIGLFGSYAKSQENENSDIDVLIEFEEGNKTFDNYMDFKFYLEDRFNKEDLKNAILRSARYA